jgi:putative membrane protein
MTKTIRIAAALSTLALAFPAVAQPAAKNNSAVKTAHTVDDGGARKGANSFTEAQARAHIAKSGFTGVSPLKKDAAGVWRGIAMKDGRTISIGLDFKGNISTAE